MDLSSKLCFFLLLSRFLSHLPKNSLLAAKVGCGWQNYSFVHVSETNSIFFAIVVIIFLVTQLQNLRRVHFQNLLGRNIWKNVIHKSERAQGLLQVKLRKKWHGWTLYHDNVPAHMFAASAQFLEESGVEVRVYLLYSSDLAPCDFCLFSQIEKELKCRKAEWVIIF